MSITTLRASRLLETGPEGGRAALEDFRVGFYYPAVSLMNGSNPYDATSFLATYPVARSFPPYPPTMILLHLPLASLPPALAAWVHYGLNVLLLIAVAAVALSACGIAPTAAAALGTAAALAFSRPGSQTLYVGQCTVYVVLACLIALRHARSRPGLAGLGLAVACAKPTFGLPLVALLWADGRRRTVAIAVTLTAAPLALLTGLLVVRAGGMARLWRAVAESLHRVTTDPAGNPATSLLRIDAAALLARAGGSPLGLGVEAVLGLGLLALACRRVARLAGDHAVGSEPWLRSASVMIVALLACTYHQAYDGLLLVLPAVALAAGRLYADRPVVRRLLLTLIAVQAVNYVATYAAAARLALDGGAWLAVASINGAMLLTTLVVLSLVPATAPARAARRTVEPGVLPARRLGVTWPGEDVSGGTPVA